MKLAHLKSLAVAVAATACVGSASAIPIVAVFNVAALGPVTSDTGQLANANTISTGAPNVVGFVQQSNIGVISGQSVTLAPNPMGVRVGDIFTKEFTTPLGTFLETLTVTSRDPGLNALGILAVGTITQTVGVGFDPTQVFWSAAYTQNAGPGGQINASFNNSTVPPGPPNVVPEPATLALVGLALAGLGVARRRVS